MGAGPPGRMGSAVDRLVYGVAMRTIRMGVIAVALLAAAVAPGTASAAPPPPLGPPTEAGSWVGRLVAPVSARVSPGMSARVRTSLSPVAPLGGGPTVLEVLRVAKRADGTWLQVRLPVRPNGSRGWIPAGVLRLRHTALGITVDLSDRRLTLRRGGRVVLTAPAGVGAPGTPTPTGRFAVAEMIRTRTPRGFLGPVVFPLTGFSKTLNEYAGGNGRVAIHGTSLPELVGGRVSHGCVRLRNADVLRLARLVRPGTPVRIVP